MFYYRVLLNESPVMDSLGSYSVNCADNRIYRYRVSCKIHFIPSSGKINATHYVDTGLPVSTKLTINYNNINKYTHMEFAYSIPGNSYFSLVYFWIM